MTIAVRPESQANVQPVRAARLRDYLPPGTRDGMDPSTAELAFRIFAAFRAHPHINNRLTHISRVRRGELEQSLNRILDVSTTSDRLSPLDENIIDLMVGERGVTGRILKPYFQAALRRLLEPSRAERLLRHISALYLELEWKVPHPAPSIPAANELSEGSGDAGSQPQ